MLSSESHLRPFRLRSLFRHIGFLGALLFLVCSTPALAQDNPIQWYKDLPQASAFARKSDKPMMIEFWADWCAPCKQELPMLDDMANRLRAKGIEIVAVSIDDNREDAETFLRSRSSWSRR